MRVTKLHAENVMRIKAVTIEPGVTTPDADCIVIGGRNGQGKSSTLEAIAMAFSKKLCPSEALRKGEAKGVAEVTLDNGLKIKRVFTQGSSRLEVTNADGSIVRSPQKMLDDLFGLISFRPLDFYDLSGKQQIDSLKELVGLDFTALDTERETTYNERTAVNRQLKDAKARFSDEMMALADQPDVEACDSAQASKALTEMQARNKARRDAWSALEACDKRIVELEQELAALRVKRKGWEDHTLTLGEQEDEAPLQATLSQASETAARASDQREARRLKREVSDLAGTSENMTERLKQIDTEKLRMMREARFPVEGLELRDEVYYQGVPLSQASAAEKVRVASAIGMAMNPDLKVLLVKDAAYLDDESMASLRQITTDNGYQIWIERVGRGEEVQVILEDGEIDAPPA